MRNNPYDLGKLTGFVLFLLAGLALTSILLIILVYPFSSFFRLGVEFFSGYSIRNPQTITTILFLTICGLAAVFYTLFVISYLAILDHFSSLFLRVKVSAQSDIDTVDSDDDIFEETPGLPIVRTLQRIRKNDAHLQNSGWALGATLINTSSIFVLSAPSAWSYLASFPNVPTIAWFLLFAGSVPAFIWAVESAIVIIYPMFARIFGFIPTP